MASYDHLEAQREREVHRYYQPWLAAQGSALNVAVNVDSIALEDLHGSGYKPKASRDKTLTGFAHLAVLRLNVKRAMVSLIDSTQQMILAEATHGTNLGTLDSTSGESNPELWLGATVLSRPDAICEHCFSCTITAQDPGGKAYIGGGLVVPDCRLDPRFQSRPYVQAEGGVRFYAGVPIITRNGLKIGAYAVSDDKPRHGLTVEELRYMQGVAQAVMEHFEWARDRVDRFKGERIVRGLASFIENCSTSEEPSAKDGSTRDDATEQYSPDSKTRPPPSRLSLAPTRTLQRIHSYQRNGRPAPPSNDGNSAQADRPPTPASPRSIHSTPVKGDSLSRMFLKATETLRQSTLADGVVLFGTTTGSNKQMSRLIRSGNMQSAQSGEEDDAWNSTGLSSDSDHGGGDSASASDSDATPAGRPCKILAYSLADEKARADIEKGSALSLGTLERYFTLYPRGKTFSFTQEGSGISSEDESASDRETIKRPGTPSLQASDGPRRATRRRRGARMDHKELLKKIPGAKTVVFLPLYDHGDDKLAAGFFLWTSVTGRMMSLDDDLSYLRAFGNSIISEVGRINTLKNESAKTTFIASMSHELRSPLHGILGAAEFLVDTAVDSYQSGLITSISTCGKTLLDTLNHVLDYSKINRLGRAQMRRHARQNKLVNLTSDSSLDSLNLTAVVDLAILVEEVVDAVTAGNSFKKLPGIVYSKASKSNTTISMNSLTASKEDGSAQDGPVSVLLDINPRVSWMVRTQPGALRRIIMNLVGNALKYTNAGFVLVSLRAQENIAGTKTHALLRVEDTGKGMSDEFRRDRLFIPFSQEDSFQPGTGLGLSIVKQIVDSLDGTIDVKSKPNVGTEIEVRLSLPAIEDHNPIQPDQEMSSIAEKTKGLHLALLDVGKDTQPKPVAKQIKHLNQTLTETCSSWFEINVLTDEQSRKQGVDIFMYCEPPSVDVLQERFKKDGQLSPSNKDIPIIIVCLNAEEAITVSKSQSRALTDLGKIVEVIPQPCGPRKLAKVFQHCIRRAEEMAAEKGRLTRLSERGDPSDHPVNAPRKPEPEQANAASTEPEQAKAASTEPEQAKAASFTKPDENLPAHEPKLEPPEIKRTKSSPPPLNPSTPALQVGLHAPPPKVAISPAQSKLHILLVDDNRINLQLLIMFIKKHKFSYEDAENGQEALDKFKGACLPGPHSTNGNPRRFDFVLMDISMPIMDGLEATRRIRDFERENGIPRTNVIALTGLASAEAQMDAQSAGVDVFLPKPVRFAELKKILEAK